MLSHFAEGIVRAIAAAITALFVIYGGIWWTTAVCFGLVFAFWIVGVIRGRPVRTIEETRRQYLAGETPPPPRRLRRLQKLDP